MTGGRRSHLRGARAGTPATAAPPAPLSVPSSRIPFILDGLRPGRFDRQAPLPTGRRGQVECDVGAAGSAKSGRPLTHGYPVVDASDTLSVVGPRRDRKSAQPASGCSASGLPGTVRVTEAGR